MANIKRTQMTVEMLEEVYDLWAHKYTPDEIAKKVGVGYSTVLRYLRRFDGRSNKNDYLDEAVMQAFCLKNGIEYVKPVFEEEKAEEPEVQQVTQETQANNEIVQGMKEIFFILTQMQEQLKKMCAVWGADSHGQVKEG